MSEIILAQFSRVTTNNVNGTILATGIHVYLQKVEAKEAANYKGADPHYTYKMNTFELPTINPQFLLARDIITDMTNIDPLTSNLRFFHIISDPEPSPLNGTWRWVATKERGT